MTDTKQTPPATEPDPKETEGKEWPNTVRTRAELDSALEAGLASGISPYTFDQIVERVRARLRNG